MSEQHNLEIAVRAEKAEDGLARFGRAVDAAETKTRSLERTAASAFQVLDQMSRTSGLGAFSTDLNRLNDNFRTFNNLSKGAFSQAERDVRGAAKELDRLSSALGKITSGSSGLGTLAGALDRLSRVRFDAALPASLENLSRALRALPSIRDGKVQGLATLAPALEALSRVDLSADIGAALTGLSNGLRTLPSVSDARVRGLSAIVAPLQKLSSLTAAPTMLQRLFGMKANPAAGQGLLSLAQALAAIPKVNAASVRNIGVLADSLARMPNVGSLAPGLVQMGQALSGFALRAAPVNALERMIVTLETADPAKIARVAEALRKVADSGIGKLTSGGRLTISPTVNQGGWFSRNGSNGNGGGGSGGGWFSSSRYRSYGAAAAAPAPHLGGSFSPTSQIASLAGVAGGSLSLGAATQSIMEAGQAYEKFKMQMMATARAVGETDKEWAFVTREADRLGLSLDALIASYGRYEASVKMSGYSMEEGQKTFSGFATGFKALGMSGDQVKLSLKAVEQMMSKGSVQAEELKTQLGDHFPGAMKMFADAMGVSQNKLMEMMKKGEVGAENVIKAGQHIGKVYGNVLPYSMNSADTAMTRFENRMTKLKIGIWQGGFAEGLKDMFGKLDAAMDSSSFAGQANRIGTSFRTMFNMIGDGGAWAVKHIEGVKLALVTLFALSGLRLGIGVAAWILQLGPMALRAAAGIFGLSGAFRGLGAALAGRQLGAVFMILVAGAAAFLAKAALVYAAFKLISGWMKDGLGDAVDWENGLVKLGDAHYTFGQVAQAAWQTARQYGEEAWTAIETKADQTWAYLQDASVRGGGGVTGAFRSMANDATDALAVLFPNAASVLSSILSETKAWAKFFVRAYQDPIDKVIGLFHMLYDVGTHVIRSMIERMVNTYSKMVSAGDKLMKMDYAGGIGDIADAAGSALNPLWSERQGGLITDIGELLEKNAYLSRSYTQEAGEAVKKGMDYIAGQADNGAGALQKFATAAVEAATVLGNQVNDRFMQNLTGNTGPSPLGYQSPSNRDFSNASPGTFGLNGIRSPRVVNYATIANMGDPRQTGWAQQNLSAISTSSGKSIQVNKQAAADFQAFLSELEATGYKIRRLGGFNVRNKVGGTTLSQHSWGNAIDINDDTNPFSHKFITDLPPNISEMAARHNLSWGGDWKGKKDTMHFEWQGPRGGAWQQTQPSWEDQQAARLREAEALNAANAPKKDPAEYKHLDLTYDQWMKILPLAEQYRAEIGKTTLEGSDYVEVLKKAGVDTKDLWSMEQARMKQSESFARMSDEDKDKAMEAEKILNNLAEKGVFLDQQKSAELLNHLDTMKKMEITQKQVEEWRQKLKARDRREGMETTWTDWQRISGQSAAFAQQSKAAQGNPEALAQLDAQAKQAMIPDVDPYQRAVESLKSEIALQKLSRQEREVEEQLLQRKNQLMQEGVYLSQEQEASLRGLITEQQKLAAGGTNGFKSWTDSLDSFDVALAKVEHQALEGLSDALTEFVTTGKMNFEDLSNSIVKSVTKAVINEMMQKFIKMLSLDGGGEGGGGGGLLGGFFNGDFLGKIGSALAGGFSEGGLSTAPVHTHSVPVSAFSGAPHFSEGGISSGGIPAVLHDDEAVVPLSRGREIPVRLTGSDRNANAKASNSNVRINMTIHAKDADSFRRSMRQIQSEASVRMRHAAMKNT